MFHTLIGTWLILTDPDFARRVRRDERGSGNLLAEVLIIGGVIVLAGIVIVAVRSFVRGKLPGQ